MTENTVEGVHETSGRNRERQSDVGSMGTSLKVEAERYARAAAERPSCIEGEETRVVELLCTEAEAESTQARLNRRAAASIALARVADMDVGPVRESVDILLDELRTERTREISSESAQLGTLSGEITDNLVRTIARVVTDTPEAVADRPDLSEFLHAVTPDREPDTLRAATEAVFAAASDVPQPELVAGTMATLTRYPDSTVQAWSAGALGRLAAAHPDVVAPIADELYPLLDHRDRTVQHNAVEALGSLARARPDAVAPGAADLRALLDHDDPAIQHNATAILNELVEEYPDAVVPAVDDFRDLTDHGDEAIQRVATRTLVRLAQERPGAITEE